MRGILTGAVREALAVLVGEEARGLSPAVVSRLKAQWSEAYSAGKRRDLSDEPRRKRPYLDAVGGHCLTPA